MKAFYTKSLLFLSIIILFYSCVESSQNTNDVELKNKIDTVSYSLGINIGQKIIDEGATEINTEVLIIALNQALEEDSSLLITPKSANIILQKYFSEIKKVKSKKTNTTGKEFLEQNKNNKNVFTLESGLQYQVIKKGSGTIPQLNDMVTIHFKGTFIDETVFDNTFGKNPVTFPVGKCIAGWEEALQLMPVGSTWKLFIPAELAYGKKGSGEIIKPNTVLIYEIKLIKINTPH